MSDTNNKDPERTPDSAPEPQPQEEDIELPPTFTGFLWEVFVGSQPEVASPQTETSEGSIWNTVDYLASFIYPSVTSPTAASAAAEEAQEEATAALAELQYPDDFEYTKLGGRDDDVSPLLTTNLINQLRLGLPRRLRDYPSYHLIYSLEQHGISIHTLYKQCALWAEEHGELSPIIIAIKDSNGVIFGGYLSEMLRVKRGFIGNGESFLYNVASDKVNIFRWSGKNDYVAVAENGCIAMGNSGGRFGWFIDAELYKGYTAVTDTFDNTEPLNGHGEFICVGMEIWGINDV